MSLGILLLTFKILLVLMLRIHDILVWIRIRIRGSMPLTKMDPDPDVFIIDLQDANKKLIKKVFLHITF
jgi:hypothetical protein